MEKKDSTKKVATKIVTKNVPIKKRNTFGTNVKRFFEKYGKVIAVFAFGVVIGIFSMVIAKYNEVAKLENGTDVAVEITGTKFTAAEIYEILKEDYGNAALLELVDTKLLNADYTDEEIKDDVDETIEYYKNVLGDDYESQIAASEYRTEEGFREVLSLNYKTELAIQDTIGKTLSEKSIQEYYEENIFGDIKVSHIIITPDVSSSATDEEKEEANKVAKAKVEELIEELNKSDDVLTKFAELAKEYSEDGSASSGGNLGYISRTDSMDETFLEEAFKLGEKGDYTKTAIESQFGYHIIIKTDVDKERPSLEDSKTTILRTLANEKLEDDPTLQISAMDTYRKDKGFKIYDQALERAYETYLDLATQSILSQSN